MRRLCFLLIYDTRPTRTAIVVAGLEGFRPLRTVPDPENGHWVCAPGQRRVERRVHPAFLVLGCAPDAAA